MKIVIDYSKYYANNSTGRPKKSEYVEDPIKYIGQMKERIHKELLAENRQLIKIEEELRRLAPKTKFWTPSRKTNNAIGD